MVLFVGGVCWNLSLIAYYNHWLSNTLLVTPNTSSKMAEIMPILEQKFTYLAKGSTHIAYLSEDGQYVLKRFIEKPTSSKKRIPFLSGLGKKRKELKRKRERYEGCINAYSLLPQETGMIYFHFAPTNIFSCPITLIDKAGKEINIDPDSDNFFIQKKALVTWDYVDACKELGELEKAKQAIQKLLDFTLLLYRQGIVMVDLQLMSNFGFIDDTPIRIDVEHIRFDKSWKTRYQNHLQMQLQEFRKWIEENHPELLEDFDHQVLLKQP
jgi:hypothetical protein